MDNFSGGQFYTGIIQGVMFRRKYLGGSSPGANFPGGNLLGGIVSRAIFQEAIFLISPLTMVTNILISQERTAKSLHCSLETFELTLTVLTGAN